MKVAYLEKFRRENRRIDYYPTVEAVNAIESIRKKYPKLSVREVVDLLVTEGIKVFPERSASEAGSMLCK